MSNWKFKDYRYILPVYPFFYLFLGSIFYNLKSRFPKIEKYYSLFFVLMLIFAKFSFDNQNAYIMSKRVSYYGYKQASEFLKPLLKVDDLVIASSWSQLRFYLLHPNLRPPPRNETDLCRVLEEENVRYIETDPYEWSQPKYFLPYLYSSVNNLEKICSDKFSVKPIFWVAEPTSEAQGSPVLTVILQVSDAS